LRGKEKAKSFLSTLAEDSIVFCSAITVAEIYAGMKPHEKLKTGELIEGLNIVDVDRQIAEKAGNYKSTIKNQTLELADCIIAATAFVINAVLATGNAKHYPMADVKKQVVFSE
jgi:predicted nucleic acid-binding protein